MNSIQAQSCHLRELDLCAATLVVFTQNPSGLALTNSDLDKQCVNLREADNCINNFIKRCTTPLQRQMVTFIGEGSEDLLNDFCKSGTELRKAYLKHANCLNGAQKTHQKSCIKDLQASFETLTSIDNDNWQKRLPVGCCTYRRFEQCIGGQVEKKCGKEAVNFISLVLKRAFSRMPDMICKNYKPDGNECKAILPAPGTVPKGKHNSCNTEFSMQKAQYSPFTISQGPNRPRSFRDFSQLTLVCDSQVVIFIRKINKFIPSIVGELIQFLLFADSMKTIVIGIFT